MVIGKTAGSALHAAYQPCFCSGIAQGILQGAVFDVFFDLPQRNPENDGNFHHGKIWRLFQQFLHLSINILIRDPAIIAAINAMHRGIVHAFAAVIAIAYVVLGVDKAR